VSVMMDSLETALNVLVSENVIFYDACNKQTGQLLIPRI
jgi:hypothetical protein